MTDAELQNHLHNIHLKNERIKRLFDIVVVTFLLFLLLPLFLVLFILLVTTSQAPFFYKHDRLGKGGKVFYCYKLRTMSLASSVDTLNAATQQEWQEKYKLQNDPRITPVGKWLRRFSLDELPQLLNVLKGDLSLVGPRPVTREELKTFWGPQTEMLLSIRPGLTGLWQVSGRNTLSYKKRIELELSYIQKQNLLLDIKILCKTLPAVLGGKGAY